MAERKALKSRLHRMGASEDIAFPAELWGIQLVVVSYLSKENVLELTWYLSEILCYAEAALVVEQTCARAREA